MGAEVSPAGRDDGGGGIKEVETYLYCHQNTVSQFIATMTIMDLCLAEEKRLWS